MSRPIVRALGGLALLTMFACSRRPVGQASGVRPSGVPSGIRAGGARTSETSQRDAAGWFSEPVLAAPELGEVREAIEARDDELAALTLHDVLQKASPKPAQRARWQYLLGLIEERRSEMGQARVAYRAAASEPGPLKWDALVHLADVEISSGNCPLAKPVVLELEAERSRLDEVAALKGRIAACEGDWATARREFAVAVESAPTSAVRAHYSCQLAEHLVRQVGPCGQRPQEQSDEIVALVARARELGSGQPSLVARLTEVTSQLSCPNQLPTTEASAEASLSFAEQLIDQRRWDEAKGILLAWEATIETSPLALSELCRVQFALGRVASTLGTRRDAEQRYEWVSQHCEDSDQVARALFLRGGLLAGRGQPAEAIGAYFDLERRFPQHRLADDAALKTAQAYRAMGSEKQFVEILDAMAERYPEGDMTQEGQFQLALNYMLKRDFSTGTTVLERAERLGRTNAVARQVERDRVAYFLARCRLESNLTTEGLAGLEQLVIGRPLTYYMLLAYSRLLVAAPDRAGLAIAKGLENAVLKSDSVGSKWAPADAGLKRVVALLAVGDLENAGVERFRLPVDAAGAQGFWTMVDLYAQAGAWRTALTMAKSRAEDVRLRWPLKDSADAWQQAYPRPYRAIVRRNAAETNVPEQLIYAVMREESEFEPTAVSAAQAYGLMQLIVPTAETAAKGTAHRATAKTLLAPVTNIALGSRVLKGLLARFDGRVPLAVAGYNAGPGRASRWLKERPETPLDLWVEAIEYAETRGYVKRVLESRAAYGWLYASDTEQLSSLEPLPVSLSLR